MCSLEVTSLLVAGPHAVPDARQPGAPGHDDQDPRGLPTTHHQAVKD
jgi:hypothetical protein